MIEAVVDQVCNPRRGAPRWLVFATLAVATATMGACASNEAVEPELDEAFFRCEVLPVLDAGCSTLSCHGDEARPFLVYTRNRRRLDDTRTALDQPLSAAELEHNFLAAWGFVEPHDPDASPLLAKPLDESAGGWYHEGREQVGARDVFADAEDPGYLIIRRWIDGETAADPACMHPGEAVP